MSSSILKVLIAGGGTGGHLFPAIAIGDELKKDNIQVKYIGSKHGIESSYKFIDKKDLSLLDLRGIQRSIGIKSILRNLVLPIKIIKSFYQVNSIIKTFKPDMISSGYAPTLRAHVAAAAAFVIQCSPISGNAMILSLIGVCNLNCIRLPATECPQLISDAYTSAF